MQVGEHITLPTYVNYTFNIADKINDTTPLDELYGLAQRSSPPKEKCNLCNGMPAFCTAVPTVR